jgi:hypothetical protein
LAKSDVPQPVAPSINSKIRMGSDRAWGSVRGHLESEWLQVIHRLLLRSDKHHHPPRLGKCHCLQVVHRNFQWLRIVSLKWVIARPIRLREHNAYVPTEMVTFGLVWRSNVVR